MILLWVIGIVLVGVAGMIALNGFVFLFLFNHVLASMMGLSFITFWQGLLIMVVSSISAHITFHVSMKIIDLMSKKEKKNV